MSPSHFHTSESLKVVAGSIAIVGMEKGKRTLNGSSCRISVLG